MIKIIRPGHKEFYGFCDRCGCEFTYELDDLKLTGRVDCPTCNKAYYHPALKQDSALQRDVDLTWSPDSIPCITPNTDQTDPCAGCGWREILLRDGVYIGDTPCTWCPKNQFNCITTGQPSLDDYKTLTRTPPAITYDTGCNCDESAVCSKCSGSKGTVTALNTTSESVPVCLCEGDIWNACNCHCDTADGKATITAVEAALTSSQQSIKGK